MGLKERGGKIATQTIPNVKKETLRGVVLDNVEKGSLVSTDELIRMVYWRATAISTAR